MFTKPESPLRLFNILLKTYYYLIFVNLFKKIESAINNINSTVPKTIKRKIQINTLDELIRIQNEAKSPIRHTVTHSSNKMIAAR